MIRVLQGDCRVWLKALPSESVHCVVTSPPYWGLRDYGVAGQIGLEPSYNEFIDGLVSVFREVRRVLRSDGTAWVNIGDSYHNGDKGGYAKDRVKAEDSMQRSNLGANFIGAPNRMPQLGLKPKDLCLIPERLALAFQADGWWVRSRIIWAKPNPMPESITDRPTKSHEHIWLLSKAERYFYDHEAIKEPATVGDNYRNVMEPVRSHMPGAPPNVGIRRSGNKERKPASARGVPVDTGGRSAGAVAGSVPWEGDTRNKRDVWTVTVKPFSEAHFATFPPELIEPCILAGCPAGGTVLDPFGGAGTTGLVADRHGRDAILIELNPEYAEMTRKRITNGSPLFAEVL